MKHLNANLDNTTNIEVPLEETTRILGLDADNNVVEVTGAASGSGDLPPMDLGEPDGGNDDIGNGGDQADDSGDGAVVTDQLVFTFPIASFDDCVELGRNITVIGDNGDSIRGTITNISDVAQMATATRVTTDLCGVVVGDAVITDWNLQEVNDWTAIRYTNGSFDFGLIGNNHHLPTAACNSTYYSGPARWDDYEVQNTDSSHSDLIVGGNIIGLQEWAHPAYEYSPTGYEYLNGASVGTELTIGNGIAGQIIYRLDAKHTVHPEVRTWWYRGVLTEVTDGSPGGAVPDGAPTFTGEGVIFGLQSVYPITSYGTITVPNNWTVGSTTYPAGAYTIGGPTHPLAYRSDWDGDFNTFAAWGVDTHPLGILNNIEDGNAAATVSGIDSGTSRVITMGGQVPPAVDAEVTLETLTFTLGEEQVSSDGMTTYAPGSMPTEYTLQNGVGYSIVADSCLSPDPEITGGDSTVIGDQMVMGDSVVEGDLTIEGDVMIEGDIDGGGAVLKTVTPYAASSGFGPLDEAEIPAGTTAIADVSLVTFAITNNNVPTLTNTSLLNLAQQAQDNPGDAHLTVNNTGDPLAPFFGTTFTDGSFAVQYDGTTLSFTTAYNGPTGPTTFQVTTGAFFPPEQILCVGDATTAIANDYVYTTGVVYAFGNYTNSSGESQSELFDVDGASLGDAAFVSGGHIALSPDQEIYRHVIETDENGVVTASYHEPYISDPTKAQIDTALDSVMAGTAGQYYDGDTKAWTDLPDSGAAVNATSGTIPVSDGTDFIDSNIQSAGETTTINSSLTVTGTTTLTGGIQRQAGGSAVTGGDYTTGIKFWSGTMTEYTALTDSRDQDTIYYIIDA